MVDEKKEVKPKAKPQTKPKDPTPNEDQTLDIRAIMEALRARAWTAEKHRGNPQFLVGVVINKVVPKIIELLD